MTWRLIGIVILYFAVSQVAGLAAKTVFGTGFRLAGGGAAGTIGVGTVLTAIIVAAISAVFSTLAAVFAAKLYVAVVSTPQPVAAAQP